MAHADDLGLAEVGGEREALPLRAGDVDPDDDADILSVCDTVGAAALSVAAREGASVTVEGAVARGVGLSVAVVVGSEDCVGFPDAEAGVEGLP